MAISFGSIGTVCATFQGTTALTPGTICKMAVNGTVSACSAGDAFLGCVENSDGLLHAVTVRGFITVSYTGALPSYGINKLSADGNGGLQVDKENGQAYWIVQLDTVNKTITILL